MCELGKPQLARRTRGALAARLLKLRHAQSLGGSWGQLGPCRHPGGFLEAELGERVLEGGAGGGGVFQAPSDPEPLPGILLPLCSKTSGCRASHRRWAQREGRGRAEGLCLKFNEAHPPGGEGRWC